MKILRHLLDENQWLTLACRGIARLRSSCYTSQVQNERNHMDDCEEDVLTMLSKKGHTILASLPPLHKVIAHYDTPAWHAYLQHREQALAAGTLSRKTIHTICDIATSLGITNLPERIITHAPSFSAHEKQALLPPNTYVQKTLTAHFSSYLVLCSGVGEWRMHKKAQLHIGRQLALSSRASKAMTLNPQSVHPTEQLGMWPGMVSPFLDTVYAQSVRAIVIMSPPASTFRSEFSISLSLYESLVLPVDYFSKVIRLFFARNHAAIQVIEVADEEQPAL